ncbi:MAG: T9SS type A sorting domain-containing protein [Lentimicrobium sp.]
MPTAADNVIIAHAVTTGALTRNAGTTTTINVGASLAVSGTYTDNGATTVNGTFQIDAGGWATGNNLTYGAAGTLTMNASGYGVNNGTYWPGTSGPVNVNILQSVTMGFARTITGILSVSAAVTNATTNTLTVSGGTCQINNTSATFSDPLLYSGASNLVYNVTGLIARGNEWNNSPSNVTLQATTILNYPSNWGTFTRTLTGNLTVGTGTALYMDYGSPISGVGALTVGGNLSLSGSFSLGNQPGGDLNLGGNWSNTGGTFASNGRAVTFNGTGAQSITNAAGETFAYLINNKASGTLTLANNVIVNATAASPLQLSNAGAFDLNGKSLTLSNAGGNIQVTGTARTISSSVAGATINITGAKTVTSVTSGSLIIGTNITTILSAGLDFGSGLTTIQGTLQINSGGFASTNAPIYGSTSTLVYNSVTGYGVNNEWTGNATTAGAGVPQHVTLTSSSVNMPASTRGMAGNLTIGAGSTFTLSSTFGSDFNIAGNWSNSGTFTPSSRLVTFNGASAQTLTGATTFDFLTLNNSAGLTLQASSAVTVNQTLSLTSGKITLGANNLTIGASGSITGQSSSNFIVTNSTGILKRSSVGNTATAFPVGNLTTSYTPLSITNTGTTNDISVGASATITNAVTDASKIVTLQWTVTPGGSGATANITFNWNAGNQASSYNATGTGELGVYTSGPYAITNLGSMSGQSKSVTGVSLANSINLMVIGNTGAVYTAPPANDLCANATSVTIGDAAINGSLISSTFTSPFAKKDVWYSFTPNCTGNHIITVTGFTGDVDVEVFSNANSCPTTTTFLFEAATSGTTETIDQPFTTGLTYFVRVFAYNTTAELSTFTIGIIPPTPVTQAVTTNAATLLTTATATLNGNVTALGVCPSTTEKGFVYSLTSVNADPLEGGTGVTKTSVSGVATGAYTLALASLSSGTGYSFRAYVYDESNYVYGSVTTFTTVALAPNAIAASNISSTGFAANWDASVGASSYRLDVATNSNFFSNETIASEGFENSTPLFTRSGGTFYTGSSASGDRPASSPFAVEGTYSFGVSLGTATLTSNDLNTANSTNTILSFRLASFSVTSGSNGADAGDIVTVEISPDGGTTYYSTVRVLGNTNACWAYAGGTANASTAYDGNASPVDYAPSGGGLRTTDGYSTVTVTGLPASVNLKIKITLLNSDANERWLVDDLKITGNIGSFVTGYSDLTVNSTSQTVTGLSENTNYYYRVRAVNTGGTSDNSNVISVTTGAVKVSAGDGDWNSITWSPAGTPVAKDEVTIDHAVTLAATADCHDLTINSGKSLTVASGGSIITTGTVTGTVTVKRFLTKYNALDDEMFHLISSPVAEQAIRTEFVTNTPTAGHDFYKFDEVNNLWVNTRATGGVWNTSFESDFVVGRGYLVAYPDDVTKTFTGTLNSAQIILTCSKTTGKGEGWNLLGNPFPSAIDWNLVTKGTGMDNALYYYDNASANYLYYIHYDGVTIGSGQQYVPAMQGFMAHASTHGATLTIPVAAKTHTGQNVFYKSTNTVPGSIVLTVAANGHEDNAYIHFTSAASTAFDGAFDAYKLRSYSDVVPNLYTKGSDGSELAINGLPELEATTIIPVYFEAASEGEQTLTANLMSLPNAIVYLEDTKLNSVYNLTANPVYNFTSANGDQPNRFNLKFGSVGIDNPTTGEAVQVYAHSGMVYLNGAPAGAEVRLADITGRVVKQVRIGGDSLTTMNVSNLPHGMYVVTIISGKELLSRKIIL